MQQRVGKCNSRLMPGYEIFCDDGLALGSKRKCGDCSASAMPAVGVKRSLNGIVFGFHLLHEVSVMKLSGCLLPGTRIL